MKNAKPVPLKQANARAKLAVKIEDMAAASPNPPDVRISAGLKKNVRDRQALRGAPRSDAFEAIHSAAKALHSVGVIDKKTMRDFDSSCIKRPAFTARDVLRIRQKEHLSQEVLARYMGITKSTVVKWESADNTPSPMAQRLLKVIDEQGISAIA